MSARQAKRVSLDRPGRVMAGEDAQHACIVRDISAVGARLLLPEAGLMPETFTLTLDPGGDPWTCRVVWRSLGEIGVTFN